MAAAQTGCRWTGCLAEEAVAAVVALLAAEVDLSTRPGDGGRAAVAAVVVAVAAVPTGVEERERSEEEEEDGGAGDLAAAGED